MDFLMNLYSSVLAIDLNQLALYWFMFFILGTLVLYIGFGFVMAAIRAREEKKTQTGIYILDVAIALCFVVLDVLLNMIVYPIVCLDLRPRYMFTTISHRMTMYNSNPKERLYRKIIAGLFAAALDGKDVAGDHIKGDDLYFKWLG